MHYHVAVMVFPYPIAFLRFEDYGSAVETYARLSNEFFGHVVDKGALSLENAMASVDADNSSGSLMGTETCAFMCLPCGQEHCASGTWN